MSNLSHHKWIEAHPSFRRKASDLKLGNKQRTVTHIVRYPFNKATGTCTPPKLVTKTEDLGLKRQASKFRNKRGLVYKSGFTLSD